jgi:hypothetical protein
MGAGRAAAAAGSRFTIERAISMMDEAGVDRAVIVPPVLAGRPQRLCARGGEALS